MKKRNSAAIMAGCFLAGTLVGTPVVHAAAEQLTAVRFTQPVYLNGQRVDLEAYTIEGHNYVQLRDLAQLLDFNAYWRDGVRIDTGSPYTGEAPNAVPTASVQSSPTTSTVADDIDALRQEIIDRTNAIREENGVGTVHADPMMMKAAQVRAEEMAATGVYSHTRPDGTSQRTVTNCPYNSENIHRFGCDFIAERGISAAEFAVRGWRFSEGHLRNMLEPGVGKIGVGIAKGLNERGEDAWYCVQWFLRDGYSITWVDTPKIP